MKDFIALRDYSQDELRAILDLATVLKRELREGSVNHQKLKGKVLGMIFEKSSTRTRVSFETGIFQLGGMGLFLSSADIQMGRGEPIKDTAQVLSRYVDAIMIRTFAHSTVEELARHATIPVINGLSDLLHPCQVLSDMLTMMEYSGGKTLDQVKIAYIGDGNNMANSLLYGAATVGYNIAVASPSGYTIPADIIRDCQSRATKLGVDIVLGDDPAAAIKDADFVYTDVWASMGQESEQAKRVAAFANYTVTADLMKLAKPDAKFMHCLPAHRGEEVSAEVCDGPQSIIYDQAENRLHAQKAVMVHLMA
ncbi:ornithine carbamoyltransferase [Chrysiogenes arsenatis]|uniref:ornithine carbamoyltransferase n=1 Tax=Chrysiogenes arsenatis TaxID=309797 RepID=UPI0003FA0B12|nr:ornithine carbamoyltransferase [Chrysiogenes arsenatis]